MPLHRRATVGKLLTHERPAKGAEQARFRGLLDRFGVALIARSATFADAYEHLVAAHDGSESFVRWE